MESAVRYLRLTEFQREAAHGFPRYRPGQRATSLSEEFEAPGRQQTSSATIGRLRLSPASQTEAIWRGFR